MAVFTINLVGGTGTTAPGSGGGAGGGSGGGGTLVGAGAGSPRNGWNMEAFERLNSSLGDDVVEKRKKSWKEKALRWGEWGERGIGVAGQITAESAGNSGRTAANLLGDATEKVAGSLMTMGVAATGVGAALLIAKEAVGAFFKVVDAFVKRGAELARYSGPLAEAQARKRVRGILADIEEADQLGPGLARLTDAQDKVDKTIRELVLPIKKWLLEVLADIMESILKALNAAKNGADLAAEVNLELKGVVRNIMDLQPAQALKRLQEAPQEIADRMADTLNRRARRNVDVTQFLDNLFKSRFPGAAGQEPAVDDQRMFDG